MNLQRYAELSRVLEPYGARLQMADGATLTYGVSANREQLRAQLTPAKLQELPAEPAAAVAPVSSEPGSAAPVAAAKPFDGLRFRW